MSTQSTQTPINIGLILFPNLTQLDLTGPYEVFSRLPNVHIYLIASSLQPIRSEWGLTITPDMTLDNAPQMDLLCVPGGLGVNPLMEDQSILDFLRRQANGARYVTSVCTGALVLAAAGLLTGYRATSHWRSMDLLPLFGIEPVQQRVVIDRNRITGGGVTAGIDFGLVVAAQLRGEAIAQAIQLSLEYNPDPPFQSGSPEQAAPGVVETVIKRTQANQDERRAIAQRAAARLTTVC